MLVLALQFSKGIAATAADRVVHGAEHIAGSGAVSSCQCERDAPSKRKRRQDPASNDVKR